MVSCAACLSPAPARPRCPNAHTRLATPQLLRIVPHVPPAPLWGRCWQQPRGAGCRGGGRSGDGAASAAGVRAHR
eukprot:1656143-Pyramimonas_sp.AAC.3